MSRNNQSGFAPIFITLIALAGLLIGVYLVQNYTSFLPKAFTRPTLYFEPQTLSVKNNCEYSVNIGVDTAGIDTDGTDAIVNFDPQVLTIESIENGDTYQYYPGNSFDNSSGRIIISGLSSPSKPFSGGGTLAKLNFKVKQTSLTETFLNFDFDPQNITKTTDSNIVQSGTIAEILREVKNATLQISSGSCSGGNEEEPPASSPEISGDIKDSKADISWKNISNPSIFDKIEVYRLNNKSVKQIGWFYTSNCSNDEPEESMTAKSGGSCKLSLPVTGGDFRFRLYQNTASATQTVSNLLKNPSMEESLNGYPSQWWNRPGGSFDNTVAKSGTSSLKVSGPSSLTYSQQYLSLEPSTTYTASVWVKTSDIKGMGVGIRFVQLNPRGPVLKQSAVKNGSNDWQQVSVTFDTPAGFLNGRFDLVWKLNSGDVAWFDDASICKGTNPC